MCPYSYYLLMRHAQSPPILQTFSSDLKSYRCPRQWGHMHIVLYDYVTNYYLYDYITKFIDFLRREFFASIWVWCCGACYQLRRENGNDYVEIKCQTEKAMKMSNTRSSQRAQCKGVESSISGIIVLNKYPTTKLAPLSSLWHKYISFLAFWQMKKSSKIPVAD
jgi:hypothetical protein